MEKISRWSKGQGKGRTKTSKLNFSSVNGFTKSITRTGFGNGGMRLLISRFAKISNTNIMNAQIRIVHGKPTSFTSRDTMIGKITPPRLEPDAAMPKPSALFLKNHVVTQLKAG